MRTARSRKKFISTWAEIKHLYDELLRWLYGRPRNRTRARAIARRLRPLLLAEPTAKGAILAEECWALVFEVEGDLRQALVHRAKERRLLTRLLKLNEDPSLGDFSDLADRLELTASLHMELGENEKAVRLLLRSKRLANEHGFPFGGAELLADARSNA